MIILQVTNPKAKIKLGCFLANVHSAIWHLCPAKDNSIQKRKKHHQSSLVSKTWDFVVQQEEDFLWFNYMASSLLSEMVDF